MKPAVEHVDSDSGHTPSDDEKKIGLVDEAGFTGHGHLPPDPDAGLSDEERARIVSKRYLMQEHELTRLLLLGRKVSEEA